MPDPFFQNFHSPEETFQFGQNLAKGLLGGECIGLLGDLGSGKTCFAKGVISHFTGLKSGDIPSPSFTLVEEYPAKPPIYHIDLYRLEPEEAAYDIPWEDLFSSGGVLLVEWAERYPTLLRHCDQIIRLVKGDKPNDRHMEQIIKDKSHG